MTPLNAEPFLEVFRGLVRDAEDLLGLESGQLDGDYLVIAQSVKSRGLQVLFEDLPAECKALEKALETGRLAPRPGAPFTRGGFPRLWKPIYRRIFTDCKADWFVGMTCPEALRVLRQLLKGYKKYSIACPDARTEEKILEFKAIEADLPSPFHNWGASHPEFLRGFPHLDEVVRRRREQGGDSRYKALCDGYVDLFGDLQSIQYLADRICKGFQFGVKDHRAFKPKHGPGAVSEPFRESKYEFPSWPERLNKVFPFDLYGMVNHLSYSDEQFLLDESPAKLIDVPKDYTGPRLIASEPIAAQYIQQGLMRHLRKLVQKSALKHCIDFKSQVPSREAALKASLTRDLATIDLSSASDRLSCAVVECIFRSSPTLLEAFNAARTHKLRYPDGSVSELKKFAAQGAAFTFPVQTIVYAIICMGVLWRVMSPNSEPNIAKLAKCVRVYGDDIIVPKHVFDRVCDVLEVLFLKVNPSKSFSNGYFRESCGMDAFLGQDVTSCSIRSHYDSRDPLTLVSVVECANNLYQKGFIRSSSALLDTIPRDLLKKIPLKSSGSTAFGLIGGGKRHHPQRWNAHLHRTEVQVLTVASKVLKTKPSGQLALFQWFVEEPSPDESWEPGEVRAVKARYRLRWVDQHSLV